MQKFRINADPQHGLNDNDTNESDFDKLLENQNDVEENDRQDAIKAAVAAVVSSSSAKAAKKTKAVSGHSVIPKYDIPRARASTVYS